MPLDLVADVLAPVRPRFPPVVARRAVVRADADSRVERILDELRPIRLQRHVEPKVRDAILEAGTGALLETGTVAAFNMVSSRVVDYLDKLSSTKIRSITNTTRNSVRRVLVEGIERGESVRQLARRIEDVMATASRGRARVIARTEAHGAANFARLEAWMQSGIVPNKRWKTNIDGRERHTHRHLNGTVKPIGEPFEIGMKRSLRPGGFGDPAEDVNCRCALIPVVERADGHGHARVTLHRDIDEDASYEAALRLIDEHEELILEGVLEAFDEWRRALLAELGYQAR